MSGAPIQWGAGLALSMAAHVMAGGVLWWSLTPDLVTEQPSPESRMRLSAYLVQRGQAEPARPDSATLDAVQDDGARMAEGVIVQVRAGQRAPQLETSANLPVPAQRAAASAAQSTRLPAEPARAERIAAQVSSAAKLTPDITLPHEVSAPVQASSDTSLAPVLAAPSVLDALAPPETQLRAALAFSGADGGAIDPLSLAAFQSFVAPDAAGDAAAELRDGISGLLSQVPCSRLQVQFDPDHNTLQVVGHIPEDGLRAPVLEALQARMGADIAVADNLLILPRPQCGALSRIADVGLAQSTDQITNPLLLGEDTHARAFRYAQGQQLILDMTAPDYDAYVYVDYFDAQGQVIHLTPNDSAPLEHALAKSALRVGAERPGDPGLFITIGPPYGQEIAAAFAASHPLYDGVRPLVEPAADYLDWMRTKVAEARRTNPGFKGEWVYFFVTTSAQ